MRPTRGLRLPMLLLLLLASGPTAVLSAEQSPTQSPAAVVASSDARTAGPLAPWEQEAIVLFGQSDAWTSVWQRFVSDDNRAAEQVRRAAVLGRCPAVGRHDAPFLDPSVRSAIEQVAERRRASIAGHDGPALQRRRHAAVLGLYATLSASDRESLRKLLLGPAGRRARSWSSVLTVLFRFPDESIDESDGRLQPAQPIRLKTYLQAEGLWPQVLQALQAIDPTAADGLDALQPLDRYRPPDAPALRQLGDALAGSLPRVADALLDQLPPDERGAVQVLDDFRETAAAQTPRPPSALAALRRPPTGDATPPSPQPEAALLREFADRTPTDWVGDLLRDLCPAGR